ncbi:hypothetical protein [Bizionia myxarmorum]|uniref:Uncharacterized protein n=1 Tax=Bizionia myxarmorum TaxID=291186 RepID=A0A5D0R697_9FLAO|nr:hypothetical protein [Bizionia myxarmorum]TYB76381.1 hypothetical protein ES674_12400 [Bizionia myxarmorum]
MCEANTSQTSFYKALLYEEEIQPHQIGYYIVNIHLHFMENWIISEGIIYNFETVWHIREACITSLSLLKT